MKLNKKCGIFGLFSNTTNNTIVSNTITGLENLQHRGREAAGISYINSTQYISIFKDFGLVKSVFKNKDEFHMNTHSCIGHVRYSTTEKKIYKNSTDKYNEIQPLYGKCDLGEFSIAHNGNIPDYKNVCSKMNITLETESDSEIFIQMIKNSHKTTFDERIIEIVDKIPGVYSLIIQTKKAIYGVKDRFSIRPLCFAKKGDLFCFSSESTFLADCNYVRELECGEVIKIDKNGENTIYIKENTKLNFCLFEIIYFMKHTSIINKNTVEHYRYCFGYKLGEREDIINMRQDDVIVAAIPNTAIPSAKGYASSLNLKYVSVFEKTKGTGRTFILPNNTQRYTTNRQGLHIKDNTDLHKCKSIILVDDSLVRGNTIRSIIEKIKLFGIDDIHLRISSPPVISPCYYGIDIPTKEELLAHNNTEDEITKILGITSLRYLDYSEMSKMFKSNICGCCFNGKYNHELLEF